MRILVVTVVHHPLDARIHHRQMHALRRAGHQVTYAAPFLDYNVDPSNVGEDVRTYDLPRAEGRRRLRSLRMAGRGIWNLRAEHDLVLLHDLELTLSILGRFHRLPPVVLDVHEDTPAVVSDRRWIPGAAKGLVRCFVRWLERFAEMRCHLILAEHSYVNRFQEAHPVVPNLPWLPPREDDPVTEDRVIYVGRLSRGRGIGDLLSLARLLRKADGPAVHLVGAADADVRAEVEEASREGDIVWHGFLPNEEALALLSGSLAGLSLLHDEPNYAGSMPTKVVEYLAASIPVVTSPLPEAARLVEGCGGDPVGIIVPFQDPESAASAVLELASDRHRCLEMGARGRSLVENELSWDAASVPFVAQLESWATDD